MNDYSIKALKTGPSREYGANGSYTCKLYRGGKKIAEVYEAGDGGELQIDFVGFRSNTKWRSPEAVLLKEVASNTTYEFQGETYTHDIFTFIGEIVGNYEQERRETRLYKRLCKTKTVYKLSTDADPSCYYAYKRPFTPQVRAQIVAHYKDATVEFINERYI